MKISVLLLTHNLQAVGGAKDCLEYLSRKQHYTLLDMLVTQYILNEGILMRQRHGEQDEYNIEIGN